MNREIIYAVGDVHGRADLLEAVVSFCEDDADHRGAAARFVFLGDIVDRGPHARYALDKVGDVLANHPGSVLLKGNHDDWFVRFLGGNDPDPAHIRHWLSHGGWQTIASYGCDEFEEARDMLSFVHSEHMDMLKDARLSETVGDFHFVHAGINPASELDAQTAKDCMWIRKGFLDHVGILPKIVVHGHTVVGDLPFVTENRISLDTGAYDTGRLTVMVLDAANGNVRFHQTDGSADRMVQVDPVIEDRGFGSALDRIKPAKAAARSHLRLVA